MLKKLTNLTNDFLAIIFPSSCCACGRMLGKNEKYICVSCLIDFPYTNFHLLEDNLMHKIFAGRINFDKAISFLFFSKKSIIQNLLHNIKYKNGKKVAYFMGAIYAEQILETNIFRDFHYIVPVPMHPKKIIKRGYNQSEWFAKGLSEVLKIEVSTDNLIKIRDTQSQTIKGRKKRIKNVDNVFHLQDKNLFDNKNIILVDDVVTTGATLEACFLTIEKYSNPNKISICTLSLAANI